MIVNLHLQHNHSVIERSFGISDENVSNSEQENFSTLNIDDPLYNPVESMETNENPFSDTSQSKGFMNDFNLFFSIYIHSIIFLHIIIHCCQFAETGEDIALANSKSPIIDDPTGPLTSKSSPPQGTIKIM